LRYKGNEILKNDLLLPSSASGNNRKW